MPRSHNNSTSHAYNFTLVELCVVCAIFAVLSSLLVPVLRGLNQKTQLLNCLSNLSGHGKSISHYQNDYNDHIPLAGIVREERMPDHFRSFDNRDTVNKTNAMTIKANRKGSIKDYMVNGAFAMAMYDSSPAQQTYKELSSSNTPTVGKINNSILHAHTGYEHFMCPSDRGAMDLNSAKNWLAEATKQGEQKQSNFIAEGLTRFRTNYGINLGVAGIPESYKNDKEEIIRRSAEGRISLVGTPSKTMLLSENNIINSSIHNWSVFGAHAFTYGPNSDYPEGTTLHDFTEDINNGQRDRIDLYRHDPHLKNANVLFVDGHAEAVPFLSFPDVWMSKGILR